jgi:hypothetical protein
MLIKNPEERIDASGILEYLNLNYIEDIENKIIKYVLFSCLSLIFY